MYDKLKDIFDNVNEWLRFAEAKHGALIVLNSGVIFGVLSVRKDYPMIPEAVIMVSLACLGLSILFSFVSLFPRSRKRPVDKPRPKNANLFFNGHLCLFDTEDLKAELNRSLNTGHLFTPLEENLVEQIIIASGIASTKYILFKRALIATVCAFVVPVLYAAWLFAVK
ncbi:MAG: Pycsar system effector family protein [Bacteroidota bacterium]